MQFLSRGGTRQKNPYAVISVGIGRNTKSGLWGKGIPFRAVIPWSLHQPITIPHLIRTPCNHSCCPWLDLVTWWLTVSDLPDIIAGIWEEILLKCVILWWKWYQSMLKWQETRPCNPCPQKNVFRFICNNRTIVYTEQICTKNHNMRHHKKQKKFLLISE